MKMTVIHDEKGKVVGALRAEAQTLPDGRKIVPAFQLPPGHTSRQVDVPDHLKGNELLQHVAKQK
jgi:hypothetical protein